MWCPILQEDGTYGGLWNATIDTTKKVLAERRLATVREMGERTSIARTIGEFTSAVMEILAANARDAPFALLYSVDVEQPSAEKKDAKLQSGANGEQGTKIAHLEMLGSIGVPEGHPSAPRRLAVRLGSEQRDSLKPSTVGPFSQGVVGSPTMSFVSTMSNTLSARSDPLFARSSTPEQHSEGDVIGADHWPIREALQSKRLVLVEDCASLIEGYPIRVWDELPNSAIVMPIANDSDEGIPPAVLVIGLSIRRPFDEDYESFIHV